MSSRWTSGMLSWIEKGKRSACPQRHTRMDRLGCAMNGFGRRGDDNRALVGVELGTGTVCPPPGFQLRLRPRWVVGLEPFMCIGEQVCDPIFVLGDIHALGAPSMIENFNAQAAHAGF